MAPRGPDPLAPTLVDAAVEERLSRRAPLAARLRPRNLDEVVGQSHLLAEGAPLRALIESDRMSSTMLWGPPGTGKTTLAMLVAQSTANTFVPLSAVNAGVREVREVIESARRRLGDQGTGTILFLDEVHRFNKGQQDALLPAVEAGLVVLIGATTENPYFQINSPLLSRSTLFRLEPLAPGELRILVDRGLSAEGAKADADAVDHLVDLVDGDGRALLNSLEVAVAVARSRQTASQAEERAIRVTLPDAEAALATRALRYGEDDHYDVASAFIKSLRGSDVDAGLYWLARMLEAGEDPRFIARRLVILASEDVGLADSSSLLVADAAARAVEVVGLPEAALNLAHAVVQLALAPKSNSVTQALARARADVADCTAGPVPAHLRGAPWPGDGDSSGAGESYRYPHDHPDRWVDQEYRPSAVAGGSGATRGYGSYYVPSDHGEEAQVRRRLEALWGPQGRDLHEAERGSGRNPDSDDPPA